MAKKRITLPLLTALKTGKILLSDGALGTTLQQMGLKAGECPESWNFSHPEKISEISKSYYDIGAQMSVTNSFGANYPKLSLYHLEEKTYELNFLGANLTKKVCPPNCWVLGSIGSTGKMLIMDEITEEELEQNFKCQVMALEEGGADAILVETMMDGEEACVAVKAAKEYTSLPVICTFTFELTKQGSYKTIFGLSPKDAALMAIEDGADIIGTNCGNGMAHMAPIVVEMRTACPNVPILVHANAGLPMLKDGKTIFLDTPEKMKEESFLVMEAGADIIGGCCGTTVEHIKAIKEAVDEFNSRS